MTLPPLNTDSEITRMTHFLRTTLEKQAKQHVVLGVSGGIDSATSLMLLLKAFPKGQIYVMHLPYFKEDPDAIELLHTSRLPEKNRHIISIKEPVDALARATKTTEQDTLRFANLMVRVRMIMLFDLAKKVSGLVVGTENRSEHLLGYYTRFGDEASDIEPIRHLYKTYVYEVAKSLGVPKTILEKKPTAGLWHGQTDENEFGFSYEEADRVLYYFYDKKKEVSEIQKSGLPNAGKIIAYTKKNAFKHNTPYIL